MVEWCLLLAHFQQQQQGDSRKDQESIRESYSDRHPKDLHAEICTNPQEFVYFMNRCMVFAWLMHEKNTSKDCDRRKMIIMQYISFPQNESKILTCQSISVSISYSGTISVYFRKTIKNEHSYITGLFP